jgi:hypothetical protein
MHKYGNFHLYNIRMNNAHQCCFLQHSLKVMINIQRLSKRWKDNITMDLRDIQCNHDFRSLDPRFSRILCSFFVIPPTAPYNTTHCLSQFRSLSTIRPETKHPYRYIKHWSLKRLSGKWTQYSWMSQNVYALTNQIFVTGKITVVIKRGTIIDE